LGLTGSANINPLPRAASLGPYIGSYLYERLGRQYLGVFTAALGVTPSSCIAILPLALNDPTRKELRGRGLWGELRNIVKVVKRPKVRRILFMFSYDAFTWSVIGPFAAIYYVRAFNASPYDLATVNLIINVISGRLPPIQRPFRQGPLPRALGGLRSVKPRVDALRQGTIPDLRRLGLLSPRDIVLEPCSQHLDNRGS